MLASLTSEVLRGLNGHEVVVETDVVVGMPAFTIVGLPDAAVQESRERVRAAISNSGYDFPSRRITVNLAPADLRKEGPAFDLPVALTVLLATGQVERGAERHGFSAVGELALDGSVRPIVGALAVVESLRRRQVPAVIVPEGNAREAALVQGIDVYPVATLRDAAACLGGAGAPFTVDAASLRAAPQGDEVDFADVRGQESGRRALEIAAAGGHNLLMCGPPGAGKTMLARRLPTILTELSLDEAIAVTRVHSIAGLISADRPLVLRRPFRSPHHTISTPGLIGGGATPKPGEVSLAHLGVLFLDEFPEFRSAAIEALRQPLEDGEVTINRRLTSLTFPARIMLVAAMNPCPCGYRGDRERECSCPSYRVRQYVARLSGPLIDRIDLHLEVPRLARRARSQSSPGESSLAIRARVAEARLRQAHRLGGDSTCNAHLSVRQARVLCRLNDDALQLLDRAYERLHLSARACDKIVKVAQTICDLEGAESITSAHLGESLAYREAQR